MTDLVQAIDDYTLSKFGYLNKKLFGFCELMTKSARDTKGKIFGASGNQPMPVTIPGRQQVSLDDKYEFMTWIRWVEPARYDVNDEFSFGRSEAKEGVITLRIVLAHRVKLGEALVFNFANGLPVKFNMSGYNYVFVEGTPVINPDHESIYTTELGNTAYEKHRFEWNLYTVDVTLSFLPCLVTTP